MNGNIQVEPIRVKLDKQGATSLKEEKTVDAIVRPQLTITQSLSLLVIKVCCLFATGKSFREISGMGEWAPPFGTLSSPTPPSNTAAKHYGWGVRGAYPYP